MDKGKIFIALPNDTLGGAEQYLKLVASYFLRNGYSVDIFFCKKKNAGGWENLRDFDRCSLHYTTSTSEREGFFKMIRNIWHFKRLKYDYAFSSHVHINGVIGILRKCGIVKTRKFVARESTSIFIRFQGLKLIAFKALYLLGYSNIDLIICQSDFMKSQLVSGIPNFFKNKRIEVIGNPIDLELSRNVECQASNLPDKFIVSAGRLIPEKGFDILIKSFSEILKNWPGFKLIILGDGRDSLVIEDLINQLGLQNDVLLPGFVDNVYSYFKKSHLCVVSSRIEGFPNVLLQMMSQNDKVVSTICAGGISDIDGIFLAEPNNVESLSEAISLALTTNTAKNRILFDDELSNRSLDKFIEKVNTYLNS